MGGYGNYQIVGYKHLETLQSELNEFMLRRLKEDVFDLPDKIYVNEYVEMTPKQKQVYDEITQDIKMNIDKIVSSPNPLTELIRMRQATGYTGILSTTVSESAKIDRLLELLEEAKSNNQKVVIFSNWTQMTDPVDEQLRKAGFKGLKITGDTKDIVRQEYVNKFQSREVDYIIGTIGAMGTGITLTAGTIEIFLDEPWNKALKEQAVDRCHRIGTKNNVTIYTLIAKNTIDERIHEILENKGIMADAIVDGKIQGSKKNYWNIY
jgi:SNF2 family DNA or RNA helicase